MTEMNFHFFQYQKIPTLDIQGFHDLSQFDLFYFLFFPLI